MILFAGAADPESLKVTVTSGASGPDLTGATSAEGTVHKPGGTTDVWSFALGASTTTSLVLTRLFASDAGDVAVAGSYKLALRLSFGAQVRRCAPISFVVTPYP